MVESVRASRFFPLSALRVTLCYSYVKSEHFQSDFVLPQRTGKESERKRKKNASKNRIFHLHNPIKKHMVFFLLAQCIGQNWNDGA